MPPTLILIRHAEAKHNATGNYTLRDPVLTAGGQQQCLDLQRHLQHIPLASRIELIISSPMRRTIQTATLSLQWLLDSGVPLHLSAMWQENSDENCDTGTSLKRLAREFPDLDFAAVDPVYPGKAGGTPYAYTRKANRERGEACLRELYGRPEKVVAVVSHAAFLRTAISKRRYANADYRIFTFSKGPQGDLELWEDEETARKGGGMGRSEVGIFEIRDRDFPSETEETGNGAEDADDGFVDAPQAAPS